jgi:hypothetical protein
VVVVLVVVTLVLLVLLAVDQVVVAEVVVHLPARRVLAEGECFSIPIRFLDRRLTILLVR